MEDQQIIDLYWQRQEEAISETAKKYGGYLHTISYQILSSQEDAEECVNDTYHSAWTAIPPSRPVMLSAFLGKITRRISIDQWRKKRAGKRGGGQMDLAYEELEACIGDTRTVEGAIERQELAASINGFLAALPETERRVFLCRYWYVDSIADIASRFGFTESKVTSMLHRTRGKLRTWMRKEGY